MAKRFSNIKASHRLQSAYTAYKTWQDEEKVYKQRPAGSKPGGLLRMQITPFGLDSTDKVIVQVSRRSHTAIGSEIGARAANVTAAAIRMSGLQPAKIVVFRGTGTTTETRSDITNLTYQKRNGTSYTHAFGGSTATEKEFEAQQILIAAFTNTANTSVSFTPERMYQR